MSKSSKQVSEIDRLIELASDEKPGAKVVEAEIPAHALSTLNEKDGQPSMWRVLLQLRVLLPYLAKVLPMVERGLLGTNITGAALAGRQAQPSDSGGVIPEIVSLGDAQRDLHTAVKAQAVEIQLLQEQVASLSKQAEKNALLSEELVTNVAALRKLVTTSVVAIVSLLVVVIGLVVFAIVWRSVRAG